jgi:hypothetical protein
VVTPYENLNILWRTTIEKEIVKEIMEAKHKEREVKQNRNDALPTP